MKILIISLIFLGIIFTAQSQTKKPASTPSDLLEKSNDQYKAGWILLGSGTAFILTAIAMPPDYSSNGEYSKNTLKAVLSWTGSLSIIISVPVFLSAGQNARMAARLSLENQAIHQPIPFQGQINRIPSLSLKIPL